MTALAGRMAPCGPVVDGAAADRLRADLAQAAAPEGWSGLLETAWPALAPVAAAAPYLASLMRQSPSLLRAVLENAPDDLRETIVRSATRGSWAAGEDAESGLRRLKKEMHLLTALCDLGGLWSLEQVTAALTDFADAALEAAFSVAARELIPGRAPSERARSENGPVPGLFCLAMGKMGAFELNYSSDIDLVFFYDPDTLSTLAGEDGGLLANRIAERIAGILQRRTVEGYVFRVDLRLRPDPLSTPPAVSTAAAFPYYESVGQNWERAAFIKARAAGGDLAAGHAFLAQLQPFVWRRNLDFAAIADIQAIKRQIHAHKVEASLAVAGADLKLGRGGIREIEFFVQTQQLILGGRRPQLRSPRTLDALDALAADGQVTPAVAGQMADSYRRLRALEHRVQMVADEQTHRLPRDSGERRRIAALAGAPNLRAFDADTGRLLRRVSVHYDGLFPGEESLATAAGSLVFTGADNDPETLATLRRMGFHAPDQVCSAIRAWHHGTIAATRTERGRELFTRLAPRLLEAAQVTGAPDIAFARFARFFETLRSGIQVQSLFLAKPDLLALIVRIMAIAPRLAEALARRPQAMDALLDPAFYAPVVSDPSLRAGLAAAETLEAAMSLARRRFREDHFRIGVQVLAGVLGPGQAGAGYADLADDLIAGLAQASMAEIVRQAGTFPGEVAVVALGKAGSREMTAVSDLDLMTLYRPASADALSAGKGWSAETYYSRFTQRLIAALSAPTAEGPLYEVDLRLRPSGTHGPVAVSLSAFETYYAEAAETWEHLAITRARLVWVSSEAFAEAAGGAIAAAIGAPRDPASTAAEVRDMRALMERERPPSGFWDMKLSRGGLVDIEFCAQFLVLISAAATEPPPQNTGEALVMIGRRDPLRKAAVAELHRSWILQQDLSQVLRIALDDDADPSGEPEALRSLLAKVAKTPRFDALPARLSARRAAARRMFERLLGA